LRSRVGRERCHRRRRSRGYRLEGGRRGVRNQTCWTNVSFALSFHLPIHTDHVVEVVNSLRSGEGVLAEYCLVEKSLLRRKPNNVAFEEAAAVPLAAHTAFVSLVDQGGLKKGGSGKVFVNGGSGGVGAFAVQIAVAYGYQVSTTCSPSSRSLVQSLSSSIQIFDYTSSPLQEQLAQHVNEDKKPFDLIFDTIGTPSLYQNSPSYLSVSSMSVFIHLILSRFRCLLIDSLLDRIKALHRYCGSSHRWIIHELGQSRGLSHEQLIETELFGRSTEKVQIRWNATDCAFTFLISYARFGEADTLVSLLCDV